MRDYGNTALHFFTFGALARTVDRVRRTRETAGTIEVVEPGTKVTTK